MFRTKQYSLCAVILLLIKMCPTCMKYSSHRFIHFRCNYSMFKSCVIRSKFRLIRGFNRIFSHLALFPPSSDSEKSCEVHYMNAHSVQLLSFLSSYTTK